MAQYNFRRNLKFYIVSAGLCYPLEVYPDVSFSQTFAEESVPVKTLHAQNDMFEEASITKANPANFNFTLPTIQETDFDIVYNWLTYRANTTSDEALLSVDIYADTGTDIYKVEKAVLERATFQIAKDRLLSVSFEGTARKLSKFGPSGVTQIPGALVSRTGSTGIIPRVTLVELDGSPLQNITSISVELANEVQWIDYEDLHKSLYVNDASDTTYPEAFVVSSKTLSGTIQQYVTNENNENVNTWSTTASLRIRVGDAIGVYRLDIDIPSVVFTNRLDPQEIFIQSYTFRMNTNPQDLNTVFKRR